MTEANASPPQAKPEAFPELDRLVEAGALSAEKAEALAEHHRLTASSTILRAVLSVFVTLAAASIMSISFVALIVITIRELEPEAMFFLALVSYGGIAALLDRFKLRVPAATLVSIGLVTGAICALVSDSYQLLCALWYAVLGGALALTRRAIDHALLILTGAVVLFSLMARLYPVWGNIPFRSGGLALAVAGLGLLVWASFWKWKTLVGERRLKPLHQALGLAIGLGGLFLASFYRREYEGQDIALAVGAFAAFTVAAAVTRSRPALFSISLGYWILFLFWKYYELFYDLLGGSLILLVIGLGLLALAARFHARAGKEDGKATPCAT